MTPKKIAVLTGKRGGYGAMKPMLRTIEAHPDLTLQLIVTDQHLDPAFGRTITEVQKDFPIAAAVGMPGQDGSAERRAHALGSCIQGLSEAFTTLQPDLLILYGDRGEVLAAALAATHFGLPMAHLQGGDVSGNIDENMRHALTKLCHLHFPASPASAERIRRLGEEAWRIHTVGDNHVDPIVAGDYSNADAVRAKLGLTNSDKPLVVLQHPETTRARDNSQDMRNTLEAALATGREVVCVYPCSDPGYEEIVETIESFREEQQLHIFQNIDAPDFWGLLAIAEILIGNSSAGLIETPYFPIAAINLGERQKGRQHAENLISIDFGADNVRKALNQAMTDEQYRAQVERCSQPFGDGKAGERIVEVIARQSLDTSLLDKRISY